MIAADDCYARILKRLTIITLILIIHPGFHVECLIVSASLTGRTVSTGSTHYTTVDSFWFVSNNPACRTRRETEKLVSGLMFEDEMATADKVCSLENSKAVRPLVSSGTIRGDCDVPAL